MENNSVSELPNNKELPLQLQNILPCGYSYNLKKWTLFENNANHFEADFFINVYTEEEAQEWWQQFNLKSNTTMRVKATCPKTGKVNSFKIYLRCLHQGRLAKQPQKSTTRNTNCPAGMIVAIRRHIKYSRSKLRGPIDPVHPCEIKLRFVHNHETNEGDSLRVRPVSKETEEKLIKLFQVGHSPGSALEMLKMDLQFELGSCYQQISTDRSRCPDKGFCYRLFHKHFGKDNSSYGKKNSVDVLGEKVKFYNDALGDKCLASTVLESDCAIAVCSPFMKRVHSLPQCCDVVFVDTFESHSNKEVGKHYVLLLIALTAKGGLPLGTVLTNSNTTTSWKLGLQLLKELLPARAFSFNSIGDPVFLIADSEVQRVAFLEVWPNSSVAICIFRLLQHVWKWLWDEKNNILKDHRLYLLYLAKTLLFAASDVEIDEKYQVLSADSIAVHYPTFLQVVESTWEKRHTWKFSILPQLPPLTGANNYYEAAARALKDKLVEPTKSFNLIQLLDFLVTRVESYYKTKLLDILNEKFNDIFRTHFATSIPSRVDENINKVAGNYFLVPSEQEAKDEYAVDAELNVCSCPYGINGTLCQHQYWVLQKSPSDMFKVRSCDSELSNRLSYVITGNITIPTPPQISFDIQSLPQVIPNSNEFRVVGMVSENNLPQVQSIVKTFLDHKSSPDTIIEITQTSSDPPVPNINERISLPIHINNDNQDSTTNVNSYSNSVEARSCTVVATSSITDNVREPHETVPFENDSVDKESSNSNVPQNCDTEKSHMLEFKSTDKKMADVLEKFELFCQRVKDGLRNQTTEFLPALEIMMKNLERKGYSDELLVSGLSFFGVFSAPSLMTNKRKRNLKSPAVINEEIVPLVHGHQMVTYGKRRQLDTKNCESKIDQIC
ncbi:hypothetical protein JTE90_013265 [Oedothorax gibbosus]|uniref:SWIM-type domain-containing protein n=1 Tax=Oedothorax gibbosus TaxID=931172 RepID=A0AAV6VEM5_9ARAC|nr:hypothetical protein JTE90_013265 [Oedothorax gibbosus]